MGSDDFPIGSADEVKTSQYISVNDGPHAAVGWHERPSLRVELLHRHRLDAGGRHAVGDHQK
jgi:hypothetical protein